MIELRNSAKFLYFNESYEQPVCYCVGGYFLKLFL